MPHRNHRPSRRPPSRGVVVSSILVAGIVAGSGPSVASASSPSQVDSSSAAPERVLDTRDGTGGTSGRLEPSAPISFTLPARSGDVVALNVTATESAAPGHVSAWPCDEPKPETSALNHEPGRAVPNMVVVRNSDAGICLDSSTSVHLVADLMARFDADDLRAAAPTRLVDTRSSGDPWRAGETRRVSVGEVAENASGQRAAVLNLTVVAPSTAGYVTAFPCDGDGDGTGASTMNFGPGETVATLTLAAVRGDDVCIRSDAATDLLVDWSGWVPARGDLRVSDPRRLLDTRSWGDGPAASGETIRLRVAGRGGVPNSAQAAMLTMTFVDAAAGGHVTVWPCDAARPETSVLNTWPGATRANLAIVDLSEADGEVCIRPFSPDGAPVDLLADAVGWMDGVADRSPPPSGPSPSPSQPPPAGQAGRFTTLPPGATLPTGAECAGRVRPAPEIRPANVPFNETRGTRAHSQFERVDGDFTGTTDEILQWVACKWGIDEDIVRAQTAIESWWDQRARGDYTSEQSHCYPPERTSSGECPESVGVLQVRYGPDGYYHGAAFVDGNAVQSTAYNADYTYAVWRACFEGEFTWLNDYERGATYGPGDQDGCLGMWYSGRWYTEPARDYLVRLYEYHDRRIWEEQAFLNHR